jgi:hypothetical protein
MPYYPSIFNQLFNFIPRHYFDAANSRHNGDRYAKEFMGWQQFLVGVYAQATGKDSLREIESGLAIHHSKLYHLGLKPVPRSTLSDAMERRDPAILEELFNHVLERARSLAPRHKFKFDNPLYSFDSTTIDLCLSVFDWAKFRKRKGAIKLHCKLDHSGDIPAFMVMTEGARNDVAVAKEHFKISPDSIYCFDRGYSDFGFLHSIHEKEAYFVTRAKKNMAHSVFGQHAEPNRKKGVLSDEIIELDGCRTAGKYPDFLRKIRFRSKDDGKIYIFITNNMKLAASTIAEIYRQRWHIEIFFKWIKQNLKIKSFFGTSRNAVLWQIWTAMIYYLILAYVKFQSGTGLTLAELTFRFKNALFDRFDILELISITRKSVLKAVKSDSDTWQPELFTLY